MSSADAAQIRPAALDDRARDFLAAVERADGIAPLSEGVLEAAAQGRATTLGAFAHDALVGFAAAAEQGERGAAELAIAPDHRGAGTGGRLADALRAQLGDAEADTWFWSHGDFPAAARLAAERGYARSRELLQLSTPPLAGLALPAVQVPDGVEIRTFRPGDEEGWLRVNNAAFDWHPEQGHQDLAAFTAHTAAPGFEPAGVFFAVRDGAIIGFHETKLTPGEQGAAPLGEVYVVGVDPAVHARGVGRALTLAGMHHMRARGARAVELYVESDNAAARRLYESLGFDHTVVHVSYEPPRGAADRGPASATSATAAAPGGTPAAGAAGGAPAASANTTGGQ